MFSLANLKGSGTLLKKMEAPTESAEMEKLILAFGGKPMVFG
jgi:hypothetical protein